MSAYKSYHLRNHLKCYFNQVKFKNVRFFISLIQSVQYLYYKSSMTMVMTVKTAFRRELTRSLCQHSRSSHRYTHAFWMQDRAGSRISMRGNVIIACSTSLYIIKSVLFRKASIATSVGCMHIRYRLMGVCSPLILFFLKQKERKREIGSHTLTMTA